MLFPKGVLLEDENDLLVQQTKNVQAARQLRFINLAKIKEQSKPIKAYIYEAIEVEKAGLVVKMKTTSEFDIPDELKEAFTNNRELKKAFKSLTLGRQRGYLLHFS